MNLGAELAVDHAKVERTEGEVIGMDGCQRTPRGRAELADIDPVAKYASWCFGGLRAVRIQADLPVLADQHVLVVPAELDAQILSRRRPQPVLVEVEKAFLLRRVDDLREAVVERIASEKTSS